MNYIEVQFELSPVNPAREILYAELGELGFESFQDTENGLNAYVQVDQFDRNSLESLMIHSLEGQSVNIVVEEIQDQNWNAVWESNFEPIEVNDKCVIRAPFHDSTSVPYDVVISPQMSFGTGHHETTFLISQELFHLDLEGKSLLDMGCGTGVLAILAKMLGAGATRAIDIEDWAYQNTLENIALNNIDDIVVDKGGFEILADQTFNVILANINRNVLMENMPVLSQCLEPRGCLILSGFFNTDIDLLKQQADKYGLKFASSKLKNNWAMLVFEK